MRRTCLALLALLLAPALAGAVPIPFNVDAKGNSINGGVGLDTLIHFNAGDLFSVNVDPGDLWNAGPLPRWSNADGLTHDLFATGTDDSGESAGTLIGTNFGFFAMGSLNLPYGTLVGSIGGQFFAVGTSFLGAAPASGNLLLYYWDSNNFDNSQSVTAFVDASPVPEPGSLVLLAAGLAALGGFRKRLLSRN